MKVQKTLYVLLVLSCIFFQASVYNNNHLVMMNVKINYLVIVMTFICFRVPNIFFLVLLLSASLVTDMISSGVMGFYTFSLYFSFLPLIFLKTFITSPRLPIFMLLVLGVTALKSILGLILMAFLFDVYSSYYYLKNIAFLEMLFNTIASVPIFILLSGQYWIFRKVGLCP